MNWQPIGGPADGKECEVSTDAPVLMVPILRPGIGFCQLLYTRRKSDPSKFDYTPPVTTRHPKEMT